MIAGASIERVKLLATLLPQVEKHGWDQVKSRLSERKERSADRAGERTAPEPPPPPAKGKRSLRRAAR